MYWTPAKMLLLADVDEYSFTSAGEVQWHLPEGNFTRDSSAINNKK